MNVCKKKLESLIKWIHSDCVWLAVADPSMKRTHTLSALTTLFRACLFLGIFKDSMSDIHEIQRYVQDLENMFYTGDIHELEASIDKKLIAFMTPAAKKTMGVQDESEQKEN